MKKHLPKSEFVCLMALMTSLGAFAIDTMLPAFPNITSDFGVTDADKVQLIIAVLFLGFGFGQLMFGPLSDVLGRKQPIYWGIGLFMLGSIISGMGNSFEMFLLGRFLQGFGSSATRIVSLALIRDEYAGRAMAEITSLVMTVFIIVPAIAPTLGAGILFFAHWRVIFILLFVISAILWLWFGLRQHETLPVERRTTLTIAHLKFGLVETFSQPTTVSCMIVSGMLFGIFVGYLGAVQSIFDKVFHVAEYFPLFFGVLAISIGAASFFNARLVSALGMRKLIFTAFLFMTVLSNAFVVYLTGFAGGPPPLWLFMTYMVLTFFPVGFLFGNLNALAMQPLGHIAGIGSALLGFVQSTLSVCLGVTLGHYFHENITPLVLSFGTISMICIAILFFERRFQKSVVS